jgi:hypothetical protein
MGLVSPRTLGDVLDRRRLPRSFGIVRSFALPPGARITNTIEH